MSLEGIEAEQPRVGETLRHAREARDLSLGDVSAELLVREDYLQAIENMYANGVPKGYLNGILRSYAGFLGLPAEHIIQTFAEQCGAVSQAVKVEPQPISAIQTPSRARGIVIAAAAVVLIGGGAIGAITLSQDKTTDVAIVEAGAPVNGARQSLFASATKDELLTQMPLTLTAKTTAWLEVRGADGTIFRSRKMAAGEAYYPRIGAGWTITARDGSAFVWHVGDVEIAPLGEEPSPVFAVNVDSVAAEAQAIAVPALAAVSESKPTR